MIFAVYYTKLTPAAISRIVELFPVLKENVYDRYPLTAEQEIAIYFESIRDLVLSCRKKYMGNLHPSPINGGLLIVHPKGISQVIKFLKILHNHFTNHLYRPEKAILHFKGRGKRDMQDYWNSYLKPKTSS